MTEPSSAILATTIAGGLTFFGVATGIHPELLIAGMVGALWSQTWQEQTHIAIRATNTIVSSLVSAFIAPIATGVAIWAGARVGIGAEHLPWDALALVMAVVIGLLVHSRVLGTALIAVFQRSADKIGGKK